MEIALGILIPFIGTSLGSLLVFFMIKDINSKLERLLLGFASGVMIAAAIWSLLIPSIEMSKDIWKFEWIPAVIGFSFGIFFLLFIDYILEFIKMKEISNFSKKLDKTAMLVLSVTLHNIPEGMAIGVAFSGVIFGNSSMTLASALVLSLGIAIQNIPEGTIISMPLRSKGMTRRKAFICGVLSGVVEPIAAVFTIILTNFIKPLLPFFLSFAAGAMIYVVINELIPESQEEKLSYLGTIGLSIGFLIMMVLDVALG